MSENQIVVYQPNETMRLDVRLEDETVWLTQEQIASLFGTKRPAITKHLSNIYKSGELEREGTCSILEHMGNDGKQSYRTMFYKCHNVHPAVEAGLCRNPAYQEVGVQSRNKARIVGCVICGQKFRPQMSAYNKC